MQFRNRQKGDVWTKATELIQGLPGLSAVDRRPDAIERSLSLVSTIPQHTALERVGLAAAVYDTSGKRIVGPEGFPEQANLSDAVSTRTEIGPGGVLFMFHPVVLESERRYLCLGLDADSLHALLPATSRLTPAEFAVLAGVVQGNSVRTIAEHDGVSYNTRRRQIEAALDKLEAHSQVEAVRLVYVSVVDRLLEALGVADTARAGVASLAPLYGDDVRFHWIHLAGGVPIRAAEFGEPRGRTVLLFHPLLFPCGQAPAAVSDLRRAGLRAIVPLRPGYFDAPVWSGRMGLEAKMVAWADQIDALLGFLNLDRVDFASIAISAPWASEFARRFPHRVRSMTFISAPQPGTELHGRRTASFIHSIAATVRQAPWLAEPIARLHAFRLRDTLHAHAGFRKAFRNSPADLDVIGWLARDPSNFESVVRTLRESEKGIATDLGAWSYPWESYLAGVDAPIHFFHGEQDPLCPMASIERLVGMLPQARLHAEGGQSHLLYVRGLADVLSRSLAQ